MKIWSAFVFVKKNSMSPTPHRRYLEMYTIINIVRNDKKERKKENT